MSALAAELRTELRTGLENLAENWRAGDSHESHIQTVMHDWRPDMSAVGRRVLWEQIAAAFESGDEAAIQDALDTLTELAGSRP